MKDLSIIIPVYNTPTDMMERCFASILELRDIAFEVLLIDDGSGEETAKFCKEYADEHPEFIHFRKENGGVSSARNLGLSHARGKYIAFVDADDFLMSDAFLPEYFQQDADLIVFDMDVIENDRRATWKGLEKPAGGVEQRDVLRRYLNSFVLNGPAAKLFRTAVIQKTGLRFDESFITAEDWLFGCNFALIAEKFVYINESSYLYYRDGGNSLSRLNRFPDAMLENLIGMYHKKLQILEEVFSDAPDLKQLRGTASASVVENLFNCAADLYLLKKLTPERKERILRSSRQAKEYLDLSDWKKAYLKALFLTRFWMGIYPLAHMRAFYLEHKK